MRPIAFTPPRLSAIIQTQPRSGHIFLPRAFYSGA